MRILVIDDYLNVEMALRSILDGHTVSGVRPPLLDQLVHNRTELGIWQELARFDKRLQIASAAHVHPRTLDAFTAAKGTAIDVVATHFPRPARGPEPQADGADGVGGSGESAAWAGKALLLALVGVWAATNVYDRRHPKLGHPPFDWRRVRPWPRPWAAESQTLLAAETRG